MCEHHHRRCRLDCQHFVPRDAGVGQLLTIYCTALMNHGIGMTGTISDTEINRMRWASRRGMLELDLVLEPFVAARYAQLDERDRQRFQQLMSCEDQDLFAWFLRREKPEDKELEAIVSTVLKFALTAPGNR